MTSCKPFAAALVLALVAACAKDPGPDRADPPVAHVTAVTVGSVTEHLRLSGRVVPPPDRHATLAPRVEGVLADVSAHVGERVRKGGVLAHVDVVALDGALRAAEAAEAGADAEAAAKHAVAVRTKSLLERGVVSGEQAETDAAAALAADAALSQARAARAEAARRREWATLTAPFDGVVIGVLRQAGEVVDGTAGTPVVELAAEHPLAVALDATPAALERLKEGQEAEIFLDGREEAAIPARVSGVAAAIDAKSGTGLVRIAPAVDDASLILGRVVEASVAVARHDGVLTVPESALRGGAEGVTEVLVVTDHKTHARAVVPGIHDGHRVEITSGLSPDERVVIDPVGLADEAPVRDES